MVVFTLYGIRTFFASSKLPMVAVIPQILTSDDKFLILATANSVKTPLLEPNNSCHSSTAIQRTFSNQRLFFFCEKSKCNVSGVVSKTSGIKRSCCLRMLVGVSPFLTAISQSKPISDAASFMAFAKSFAKERKGLTHISFRPFL